LVNAEKRDILVGAGNHCGRTPPETARPQEFAVDRVVGDFFIRADVVIGDEADTCGRGHALCPDVPFRPTIFHQCTQMIGAIARRAHYGPPRPKREQGAAIALRLPGHRLDRPLPKFRQDRSFVYFVDYIALR
jgi:hypothetical protein